MQQIIYFFQCQNHLESDEVDDRVGELLRAYNEFLPCGGTSRHLHIQSAPVSHLGRLTGAELKSSELQPADPMAIVAAHTLYDHFQRTGSCPKFLQGWVTSLKQRVLSLTANFFVGFVYIGDKVFLQRLVLILEAAVARSAANAQMRLLLVKVYLLLGVAHRAVVHWLHCDVKQVMYDSVGYILADSIVLLGAFDTAGQFYRSVLRYFTDGVTTVCRIPECLQHKRFGHRHNKANRKVDKTKRSNR